MGYKRRLVGLLSVLIVVSVLYLLAVGAVLFLDQLPSLWFVPMPAVGSDSFGLLLLLGVPLLIADLVVLIATVGAIVLE